MRRLVLILPSLFSASEDSALRQRLPALHRIAEEGVVGRVAKTPKVEVPEAFFLGLDPNEGQMRQGPLTVSALNADPPERSTHFHLSLMGTREGLGEEIAQRVPDDVMRTVLELATKLNTPKLTIVPGEQTDHGLVWEALGDLGSTPSADIVGKPIASSLPEGDGERLLRRLIDDSINLLSEQEFNRIREEEGLPPLNLLWPWGHGVRRPVPNLVFRRGEQALVLSPSLRLQGLTRLTGYRHGDRQVFGNGMNGRLEEITKQAKVHAGPVIVSLEPFTWLRRLDRIEEMHWLMREIDERILTPLLADAALHPTRIRLLALGDGDGLELAWDSQSRKSSSLPFDERSLDESKIPSHQIWESVIEGVHL